MKVSDFIFKLLADYGIEYAFMVSGGGAMHLNDSLGHQNKIKAICNHHEQASAIAAEGYARVTNKLAVVSVTSGPGGTNTLTGVIGAYLDSLPVLYISGQVKFETTIASCSELGLRQLGDQEINIIDIVKPITKYAVMITEAKKIKYELQKAIHIATDGRKGPVWLDIPLDIQSAIINESELEEFTINKNNSINKKEALENEIENVVSILEKSKSPIIIAGHGIRLAGSIDIFRSVIRKLNIPVVTTLNGFDLVETDNKNYMGRIGTIGNRYGNIVLQNADTILCLGTRNNIRQISYNYENFGKNAKHIIAVDIDEKELSKKTLKTTEKINANINDFLTILKNVLEENNIGDFSNWNKWCENKKNKYSKLIKEYETASLVNPYFFTDTITRILPNNAIIACTNATPSITLFQLGIVKEKSRMFVNSGCAAMGYGLPASIGAAFAAKKKNRSVICFEGDGSLMMNIQELQTIAYNNLPIKLFLFNNNEYASIRQTQDNFFKRRTGCDNPSGVSFPNWEFIAKAFNFEYFVIDSHTNLKEKLSDILNKQSMVFVNVILEKGYTFIPKLSSKQMPDGKMVSASLEDMFPFLSEEEMKNNIYKK